MSSDLKIEGECDKRFENVRKAFAENFQKRDELGAAVSIVVDGRPVVDLWGGHADEAKTRPWQRDTLVNVYSTTKGLTATCAHRLIDQGKLDPDEPVSKYWPEFAQGGKKDLPVRYILSHRAGLPAIKKPLAGDAILSLGHNDFSARGARAVVATGYQARLSRTHHRLAGWRGDQAYHGYRAGDLFSYRDRRTPRTRRPHWLGCEAR